MPKQSRIGDLGAGICSCHSSPVSMVGPIISGSSKHLTSGPRSARVTDIVLGNCGHTGIIISGSPTAFIEGQQTARVGDPFVGCFEGNLIEGSSKAIVGGED